LREAFDSPFSECLTGDNINLLFTDTFSTSVEEIGALDTNLQMKVIELKYNTTLKNKFKFLVIPDQLMLHSFGSYCLIKFVRNTEHLCYFASILVSANKLFH
jgi:hypothetical protein